MDYPHPIIDFKDGKADFSKRMMSAWVNGIKRSITWGTTGFPSGTDETTA